MHSIKASPCGTPWYLHFELSGCFSFSNVCNSNHVEYTKEDILRGRLNLFSTFLTTRFRKRNCYSSTKTRTTIIIRCIGMDPLKTTKTVKPFDTCLWCLTLFKTMAVHFLACDRYYFAQILHCCH